MNVLYAFVCEFKSTFVLVHTATCMLAVTVQTGSWILTTLETLKNVK